MDFVTRYLQETAQIAARLDHRKIDKLGHLLSLVAGRIYFAGLGGCAANCSHAAASFRRRGIDAICLSDSIASLTALANSGGWASCYSSQLEQAGPADALFVMSIDDGNTEVSSPLICAVLKAREKVMQVFSIVGRENFTSQRSDCALVIPAVEGDHSDLHAAEWQSILLHLLVSHPALHERRK